MGIHTLLRPSLHPSPRQSMLGPKVVARSRSGSAAGISIGSRGWKCNNFQIVHQERLHANLKSALR